ncbi:glucose-6-phosphate isomerase, partial [Burkholderia pseudomallei]
LASDCRSLGMFGSFASGVMHVPFVHGLPGTLLYLLGLVWLLGRALRASLRLRREKFVAACLSHSLCVFAILLINNSLIG